MKRATFPYKPLGFHPILSSPILSLFFLLLDLFITFTASSSFRERLGGEMWGRRIIRVEKERKMPQSE